MPSAVSDPLFVFGREYEHREDYEQGDYRHHKAAHGADGKRIPEGFSGLSDYERYEPEDGGKDSK